MEYFKTYIKNLEITGEYSENTIHAYSSDLKRFFLYLQNHIQREPLLSDLNSGAIKEFLEEENKLGFSPSTLHRRKISLSQFLTHLSKFGNISKNEVNNVSRWKPSLWKEIYNREVQFLAEKEINRLFSIFDDENSVKAVRDKAIISIMLETGLPIGMVIAINLGDINPETKELKVIEGNRTRRLSIKISMNALEKYLVLGRKQFTQSVHEQALFVSQMGSRITRQGVWQLVKDWGLKADLGKSLSPRLLRNTNIKRMVNGGLSVGEIQQKLGHNNRYSTRALVRKINRTL